MVGTKRYEEVWMEKLSKHKHYTFKHKHYTHELDMLCPLQKTLTEKRGNRSVAQKLETGEKLNSAKTRAKQNRAKNRGLQNSAKIRGIQNRAKIRGKQKRRHKSVETGRERDIDRNRDVLLAFHLGQEGPLGNHLDCCSS